MKRQNDSVDKSIVERNLASHKKICIRLYDANAVLCEINTLLEHVLSFLWILGFHPDFNVCTDSRVGH